jgi:hypothetical protein
MRELIVVKLIVLAFFLAALRKYAKPYRMAKASMSWMPTEAVIQSSSIDWTSSGSVRHYEPKVTYRYTANGVEQVGDNYTYLGTRNLSKEEALALSQQYSAGSKISVLVDPSDVSRSVVVPGVHPVQYRTLGFFGFFCLVFAYSPELVAFVWRMIEPDVFTR